MKKVVRIGVDLDGVVAKHPWRGFWVWLRRSKEKLLKKTARSRYYYPSTVVERLGWWVINWLKTPAVVPGDLFFSLAADPGVEFYLVTSRFKFLEASTLKWLEKHQLAKCFKKILINTTDSDPLKHKKQMVEKFKLDYFIDDSLEVVYQLCRRTKANIFWVVPAHKKPKDNHDRRVVTSKSLLAVVKNIFPER